MPRIKGNKGEWSELYAFVRLLSTGRLYAADENVRRRTDFYFPILSIFRNEFKNIFSKYEINSKLSEVEVYLNDEQVASLSMEELRKQADFLFCGINRGSRSAFEIPGADTLMEKLHCCKLKAPSSDKADIVMELHDPKIAYDHVCGFSIKSDLGHPPTLLNASRATNFIYEVKGISDEEAKAINEISCREKIIERIRAINRHGNMSFVKVANSVFAKNLMLIDSCMPQIMGALMNYSYQTNEKNLVNISTYLEETNPLKCLCGHGFYKYKIKNLLCAIALGMVPTKEWDGTDEANGGYIIVKLDGDVLAYHIYNRDAFKTYLLNNTVLERASTERHDFAKIYSGSDGKKYINLNLQIRFQ